MRSIALEQGEYSLWSPLQEHLLLNSLVQSRGLRLGHTLYCYPANLKTPLGSEWSGRNMSSAGFVSKWGAEQRMVVDWRVLHVFDLVLWF